MSGTTFQEIEHKYVLAAGEDLSTFEAGCKSLDPIVDKELEVNDSYYILSGREDVVLRHRLDAEIQQLTLKTRESDSEVRTEVNLALDNASDQTEAIRAFLAHFPIAATYSIQKFIRVFEYPDCEIVRYRAEYNGRVVHCVEFEAVGASDVQSALAVLTHYEAALGFEARERTQKNLLDLLIPDNPIAQ